MDWICAQPRLKGALAGITAAVVGVILNLSLWFALHVLFAEVTPGSGPGRSRSGVPALGDRWTGSVAALAADLCGADVRAPHWGVLRVLAAAAALGTG